MTKKQKPTHYTVDFITALPLDRCRQRLEQSDQPKLGGAGATFASVTQRVIVQGNGTVTIERAFPGAIHPIRFVGRLDDDDNSAGTWVHGQITHATENQVLIEGMIIFLVFFMLIVLAFFRLKTRAFVFTLPVLIMLLTLFSLRWRALRDATRDLTATVRRRLYLTAAQVKSEQ
ncbi:MAG: hypothetical protein K8S97_02100 [Anaerolineae bacterium]|nr:hypothetical protein [Anaerolineae bacterium]